MKARIFVEMSEADARVLQALADLCLYSEETCEVFDEHYRAQRGDTVGYPPVALKGTPSQAVQRACSAIAIALATTHDEVRAVIAANEAHDIRNHCPECGGCTTQNPGHQRGCSFAPPTGPYEEDDDLPF